MRAMRSTEIVVTNVPLEKKNLGGKSLPHTNLYLKYFRENCLLVKLRITILKYHQWYLCPIPPKNHAIICLYYYPQKVCNFHMQVFQIKLKYNCSKPIKLKKFLM